jgi:hypothetical protein
MTRLKNEERHFYDTECLAQGLDHLVVTSLRIFVIWQVRNNAKTWIGYECIIDRGHLPLGSPDEHLIRINLSPGALPR